MTGGSLRVLHVLRSGHAQHVGGDLVQLRATVAALRDEGIDAVAGEVAEATGTFDVIHLYNLQLPGELRADIAAVAGRWPTTPYVLSPILWPPEARYVLRATGPARRRLLRATAAMVVRWPSLRPIVAGAAAVLPNSQIELTRLGRLFRLPTDNWRVVPNGLDLAAWPHRRAPEARAGVFDTFGLAPSDGPLVVCVARLEAYKNQLALLEALDQYPEARLLLIGPDAEPSYGDAVRAGVSGRPGRAAATGALGRDTVAELFAAADVHVLPSYRETPGLASLEAAATGCEVVVTRCGSAEEYFGPDAHYAEPHSARSLADAIRSAVSQPRQPGLRARVERYPWSTAARSLAAVYRAVRSQGAARR